MKRQPVFINSLLMVFVMWMATTPILHAQDKKAADSIIKNSVESKTYTFVAQTAQPQRGSLRQLTSGYQLDINIDTITADLPYFGRAYTAPIDPSQGGIHFTSTDFEYTTTPKKKGGWSIVIKPKQNRDASQLILDISNSGFAGLQVISNNRESIAFNGYIIQRKKK